MRIFIDIFKYREKYRYFLNIEKRYRCLFYIEKNIDNCISLITVDIVLVRPKYIAFLNYDRGIYGFIIS